MYVSVAFQNEGNTIEYETNRRINDFWLALDPKSAEKWDRNGLDHFVDYRDVLFGTHDDVVGRVDYSVATIDAQVARGILGTRWAAVGSSRSFRNTT